MRRREPWALLAAVALAAGVSCAAPARAQTCRGNLTPARFGRVGALEFLRCVSTSAEQCGLGVCDVLLGIRNHTDHQDHVYVVRIDFVKGTMVPPDEDSCLDPKESIGGASSSGSLELGMQFFERGQMPRRVSILPVRKEDHSAEARAAAERALVAAEELEREREAARIAAVEDQRAREEAEDQARRQEEWERRRQEAAPSTRAAEEEALQARQRARIRVGGASAFGSAKTGATDIADQLTASYPALASCADVGSRIDVRLNIAVFSTTGEVVSVDVAEGYLPPETERCVRNVILHVRFRTAGEGGLSALVRLNLAGARSRAATDVSALDNLAVEQQSSPRHAFVLEALGGMSLAQWGAVADVIGWGGGLYAGARLALSDWFGIMLGADARGAGFGRDGENYAQVVVDPMIHASFSLSSWGTIDVGVGWSIYPQSSVATGAVLGARFIFSLDAVVGAGVGVEYFIYSGLEMYWLTGRLRFRFEL